MSHTRLIFKDVDPVADEEIAMSKQAADSDDKATSVKDREIRMPTWVISVAKLFFPALALCGAIYVDVAMTKREVSNINDLQKDEKTARVLVEQRIDLLEKDSIKSKGDMDKSFELLTISLKNLVDIMNRFDRRMEQFGESQHKMEKDVGVIQEQLKKASTQ